MSRELSDDIQFLGLGLMIGGITGILTNNRMGGLMMIGMGIGAYIWEFTGDNGEA